MPTANPTSYQPAAECHAKPPEVVVAEAEEQWMFTEQELAQTPSILDGMSLEQERELRTKGLNFIMQVGIMLKLPQITLSTGGVFFNRFLMRHSLVSKAGRPKALHHYQVAAVSLFLATKTEENCRKMKELIVACCRIAQKNPNLEVRDDNKDYWRWRDTILLNEDVLLEALCFDLTVESTHQLLFDLLKKLGVEHNKKLRNAAWAFVNDSCLTMLCLLFPSRTIAASAVYCAAKFTSDGTEEGAVRFPDDDRGRPWWEVQRVKLRDIKRAVNYMFDLHEGKHASGDPSIYVGLRTPEHGDEHDAKTRLRRDFLEQVPEAVVESMPINSVTDRVSKRDWEGSPKDDKNGVVDKGLANGHVTHEGTAGSVERDLKRPRLDTNGTVDEVRSNHNRQDGGGSEEGELEE